MNEARWLRIALLVLFVFFLPFVILGEGHYLVIHDFLDSSLAHLKAIKDAEAWFDKDAVLPIMGGVSRADFGSPFNLKYLLFAQLPPYWASVANLFLIKLTALLGMFLLLRCRVLKGRCVEAAALSSIAFMLLPFYPDYGISSAGVPLLAWAFFELFDRESSSGIKVAAFVAAVYYGAYSFLVLSGVFAGVVLAGVFIAVWIRDKRFCVPAFVALMMLAGLYVAGNWWLFESFFGGSAGAPVSHRSEFLISKLDLIGEMFATLAISQYHAGAFPAVVVLVAFLFVSKKDSGALWLRRSLGILAALIAAGYLSEVLLSDIQLFREFQFSRFYFLYPGLCFVLLAYTLTVLYERGRCRLGRVLAGVMVLYGLVQDPNVQNECIRVCGGNEPSFREYYDTELFSHVRESMPEPQPKVACLGLMPAVAEYNGFWTLDSYIFSYPLSYKHEWRKVIAGELAKDASLESYFDEWGSRCYLFSSELGTRPNWGKRCWEGRKEGPLTSLSIDTTALAALGCDYLVSAVPVPSSESAGLKLTGIFEGNWWKIFLYRLD